MTLQTLSFKHTRNSIICVGGGKRACTNFIEPNSPSLKGFQRRCGVQNVINMRDVRKVWNVALHILRTDRGRDVPLSSFDIKTVGLVD